MNTIHQETELLEAEFQDPTHAAYAGFLTELDHVEIAARAAPVGARMPGFMLRGVDGMVLSSGELLESGPLVVTFFRGEWCPFCVMMLAALEEAWPEIRAAGATLLALTPDTGTGALRTRRGQQFHYEVLLDAMNEVAPQFGIMIQPSDTYRGWLAEAGIDLAVRHGDGRNLIPLPATFVVDEFSVIRNTWLYLDATSQPEPDDIINTLRKLALSAGHSPATDRRQ